MFRDTKAAYDVITFGGAYLAAPNVGVQISHGAAAKPLLATFLAWGRERLAARIDHCMDHAIRLRDHIAARPEFDLFPDGNTGIVVFRPTSQSSAEFHALLPQGLASLATIDGELWLRCVSANPNADMNRIISALHPVGCH